MYPLVSKNLQTTCISMLQVLIEENVDFLHLPHFTYMHVRPESNNETSMFMLSQQT